MGNTPTKQIDWIPWQMISDREQDWCIARIEPYVRRDPYGFRVPHIGLIVDETRGVDVRPIVDAILRKRKETRPYMFAEEHGGYTITYVQNFNDHH